jgi:hypothetical protein
MQLQFKPEDGPFSFELLPLAALKAQVFLDDALLLSKRAQPIRSKFGMTRVTIPSDASVEDFF